MEKPVVMLTDGHSSRFDIDVLRYCRQSDMHQFVGPAETSGLTQLLDQVNASLHSTYSKELDKILLGNHVNRELFMEILGKIWRKWTTRESLVKAAKRVGISEEGLNVDWMQTEKFIAAEALQREDEIPTTSYQVESPERIRKGTKEYMRIRLEHAENVITELSE